MAPTEALPGAPAVGPTPADDPSEWESLPPDDPAAPSDDPAANASTPEGLARVLSDLLYDAIPRQYEKRQDWDHTKRITAGIKTRGHRIYRRKKEVSHGTWKHYRVRMVEPDDNLEIRIENLRSLESGRIAFTVYFSARLEGWAQTRVYNRGVHFITLTAEGNTTMRMWIDCEVSLSLTPSAVLTGVAVHPEVTDARLELDDFKLDRISKADGPLVHELGKGLRYLILDELEGPALVAKLNRAIDKKRDRLKFSPGDMLKLPRPAAMATATTQATSE